MEEKEKYGLLLNQNIKLHRQYFREMVHMLGITVLYRAPLPGKKYTNYAEIDTNFAPPMKIGCIFTDHPNQQTLKKVGWVAELQEGSSIIEVDYDLPGLQQGALFIVPGAIEHSRGRLFRVVKMTTSMIYPSSVVCEIVPEYEDTIDTVAMNDFTHSEFNMLHEEDDTGQFIQYNKDLRNFGEEEQFL